MLLLTSYPAPTVYCWMITAASYRAVPNGVGQLPKYRIRRYPTVLDNYRSIVSGGTQEELDYLRTIVTPLPAGASRPRHWLRVHTRHAIARRGIPATPLAPGPCPANPAYTHSGRHFPGCRVPCPCRCTATFPPSRGRSSDPGREPARRGILPDRSERTDAHSGAS